MLLKSFWRLIADWEQEEEVGFSNMAASQQPCQLATVKKKSLSNVILLWDLCGPVGLNMGQWCLLESTVGVFVTCIEDMWRCQQPAMMRAFSCILSSRGRRVQPCRGLEEVWKRETQHIHHLLAFLMHM